METRVPGFSSVLGILLLFACFSPQTEAAFDPESFQVKLVALEKVLNYINDRPEQMNVDAIFGVTLAEANLVAALLHENVIYLKNEFFFALKEITVLSDQIRRKLINTIIDTTKNETILVLSNLYNPNLWVKPILWTRILSRSRPKPSQSLNYLEVVKFMYHGTPDEMESDQCLIEIVRSSLKAKCEIPASCTAILMEEDDSSGYPLTHRLLLVQVAKAMGCKETNASSLSSLVSAYCARIYQDLVKLEAWNFPRIARDLMMEQDFLTNIKLLGDHHRQSTLDVRIIQQALPPRVSPYLFGKI
ncbi:uncharacterized protein LOC105840994 isoform X2 [Monomorium pharaonis]|uniref:uncharacterized protein LOC105840994 isoform X2 n=1 Tax=Monomorium pharaonis TaxID=307658 RepID=UPI001745CC09|nr:uncharacterized protein LOC105840994 isoform X2 [Monomorium pharaonis]